MINMRVWWNGRHGAFRGFSVGLSDTVKSMARVSTCSFLKWQVLYPLCLVTEGKDSDCGFDSHHPHGILQKEEQ